MHEDWTLTAGVRYDNYSDFGSTTNPRVALVWETTEALTLKALYGRAFRAPGFAETITVNNPVALGNPDIQPEIMSSWELAANYMVDKNLAIDVNVFKYDLKDLINFVPDLNAPVATAQNAGERSGKGVEFELKYTPTEQVNILANYSYVKAEDDIQRREVGDYPNHQGYVQLDWQIVTHWSLHSQVSMVGERKRIPGDIRDELDGYTAVNLGISYVLAEHGIKFELLGKNIFDEDIREPSTGTNDNGATPVNIVNDLPQAGEVCISRLAGDFSS